jgi:ribosomal protein L7/L12
MTMPLPPAPEIAEPVQARLAALEAQVARLTALVDRLYLTLGVRSTDPASPPDPRDDPRVLDAVRRGNRIEAVKIYRELTGLGLREAKAAVDSLSG